MQQARNREARLHKDLTTVRNTAQAYTGMPLESGSVGTLRSLTAQNEAMIGEMITELEGRRALALLLLKIMEFCSR